MFHHSANSPKNEKKHKDAEATKFEIDGEEFMKFNGQNLKYRVQRSPRENVYACRL